ncbi:MAG TPA: ABC transporter permease [Vicinamibacterales bacterium]
MLQDLRYAFRTLLKNPGFTIVAVLTLALGIGATAAIFSLFDAVVLKSLPVHNPDELLIVNVGHYRAYQAFRQETDLFSDVLASGGIEELDATIDGGVSEKARVSLVSASYFSTLGVPAAMGRTFDAGDERPAGEPAIAVASHAYWQRRLARDPAVVGRVVRIRGVPIEIVGVAPAGFFGEEVGASPDLWVPLTMWASIVPGRDLLNSPGTSWARIIGRLKRGVSVPQAEARLTVTLRRVLEGIFGPTRSADVQRDINESTLKLTPAGQGVSRLRGRFAQPLELLLAAVVLVLLISCANVANLLLARAASRRREIDLRLALGMSRRRMVRQLMTESLVLSAMGAALGLAFAWLGREALLHLVSADGSRAPVSVETDLRLVAFVAIVSVATALLFGSVPAWRSLRTTFVTSLATRRGSGHRSNPIVSPLLVVAQVAVSLVLVMGAALFLRTLTNLRNVDLGFVPERLIVLNVNPQAAGYKGENAVAISQRVLERLRTMPGVAAASYSENGVLFGRDSSTDLMRPQGFREATSYPRASWDVVGPLYFTAMGIPLVTGRDFSDRETASSPPVVAINETMARRFFAGTNPIGRRLVWGDGDKQANFEIIAVARDVKQGSPRDEPQLRFYLPYRQLMQTRPSWILASVQFVVRTAADPVMLLPVLQRAVLVEDARLSVSDAFIAPEMVDRALVQERMIAKLSIAFGMLAVGLACVGLYGLIGYQVVQRTNEIGIRMALGAQRAEVLWATLRGALGWTMAGIVLGVPLALIASRPAESLLFGLKPMDLMTLSVAAVTMLMFGALAAFVPARRASRVDPLVALRYE